MEAVDRLLSDVGQHGIGAAEGDHGHLGEEEADAAEYVVRPQQGDQQDDRGQPEGQQDRRQRERAAQPGSRVVRYLLAQEGCWLLVSAVL